MDIRIISFTDRGAALAERLAEELPGQASRGGDGLSLKDWTAAAFPEADALVFVGAAGIAVRAVAPHVRSKASDPAVVVVDEQGRYAVSLLSGHLGGANELTRRVAAILGAEPVITTATDVSGVFAIDDWARGHGCAVAETGRIKTVSGALLKGRTVPLFSPWPVEGALPQGLALSGPDECGAAVTVRRDGREILHLVPRIGVLGVGCKKGTPRETIEAAYAAFLEDNALYPQAIAEACTIDLKAEEQGLLAFCEAHGLPLRAFSAEELRAVPGDFTASAFVSSVTGVDNVCERAAVLGSGGTLLVRKTAGNGVTLALALRPYTVRFGV